MGLTLDAIRGRFARRLDPRAIMDGWHNRFSSLLASEARLRTDGLNFNIDYSPSWDVAGLKLSFEREVHRLDMGCRVFWLGAVPGSDSRKAFERSATSL